MNLVSFMKERVLFIIINICILVFISVLLISLNVDSYAIVFIVILNIIGILSFHSYDYIRKKKYYSDIFKDLESLDKKYLISEIIEKSDFLEGQLMYEIINQATKAMNDEIASYKLSIDEYREYIELWVHEVKTPISTCKLLVENNLNEITESISEEIDRVEEYIELKIYCEEQNTDIILNICDNGIGMNEKDILKVFEKGYTGYNVEASVSLLE